MSVAIRLSVVGKTHQRSFRISAQEKRSKRDGKFLEILGSVNPNLAQSKQVVIKKDRITFWQKQGAQLSPTVAYLLKNGKLPPRPKKERAKKEVAQPPQTAEQKPEQDSAVQTEQAETPSETQKAAENAQESPKVEEQPSSETKVEPAESSEQNQKTATDSTGNTDSTDTSDNTEQTDENSR